MPKPAEKPLDMGPDELIVVPTPLLNIYQRINAVMRDVSYVQKEESKSEGLKYTIVSHDAVTAKVRGAMVEHGIVYYPTVLEYGQDGNRTSMLIRTTFQNIDDKEDSFSIDMFSYGCDSQDKGPGKCISYGVKYCLLKALGLETGDDPDHDNIDYKPPAEKLGKMKRLEALWELADGGQPEVKEYIENLMVKLGEKAPDTVADITESALDEAEAHFTKIPEA